MSDPHSVLRIQSAGEVCQVVREHRAVAVRGGGTKWNRGGATAGGTPESVSAAIDMRPLSGIVDYDPSEFTIITKAGTTVREVAETLCGAGQYLPFDPMFVEQGATLGGTVAAGMNGPGRLRYGGVRDFIIGIELVTGEGKAIRGGGKVVKNAAGFDLPKLMIGSLGKLGIITELAFKVFPRPEASLTASIEMPGLTEAVTMANCLARGPFDVEALELLPPGRLIVRISGDERALHPRLDALRQTTGARIEEIPAADSAAIWRDFLSWDSAKNGIVRVRIPITPSAVCTLDSKLTEADVHRRYSVACNAAFIDWPRAAGLDVLNALLLGLDLSGMALDDEIRLIGRLGGHEFLRRLKVALDPDGKFGSFP